MTSVGILATDRLAMSPYKGDASYYSVAGPDGEITDAVWTTPRPTPRSPCFAAAAGVG
jgi:uncharacterized protein (DUF427 family)